MTPNFLPTGDVLSRSSSPHLFVDSSSSQSSCSENAANCSSSFSKERTNRPSTPHIFLSYAKPESAVVSPKIDQHHKQDPNQSADLEQLPLEGLKAYLVTSPKHPITSKSMDETTTTQSTQAGQETSETRQERTIDWGLLSLEFEGQCRRYMTEQHGLMEDRAFAVSQAMGRAFRETARKTSTETLHAKFRTNHHLAKHATMIDKAFMAESAPVHHDLSQNDLKNVCKEQEEELMFLRAALKHLVLNEEKRTEAEQGQEMVMENPSPVNELGIPNRIEIKRDIRIQDQLLLEDSSSELTPSEGDFLEFNPPLIQPRRLLSNFENRAVATKIHSPTYPELERGKVKGQHTRCLDFFMYMNDLQTLLRGKYSGKISLDTGLPHGKGVFRFENGDFYVGDFLNGMMHGEGCLFTRRRKKLLKLRGTFQNNDFFGDGSLLNDSKTSLNVCV